MSKPSNWYNMDYTERKEWENNQRAIEDAEYNQRRAEQDAEDARAQAQQARRNYERQEEANQEEYYFMSSELIEARTSLAEAREQVRILLNITPEAHETYCKESLQS